MFKSLVSAVKRLVSHPADKGGGGGGVARAGPTEAPSTGADKPLPPLARDGEAAAVASAEAADAHDGAPPGNTEDTFDEGVDDFLDNVIAGKTDKLRKEIAEQRLLSAAEEATQQQQNHNAGGADAPSGEATHGSLVRPGAAPAGCSNNPSTIQNGSTGVANDSRASQRTAYMSSAARSLQSYELIAYLGSGTFAEVTLARHRVTRELFAIKKISKQRVHEEGCVERTFTERQLLASLRHPFLVQLYQAFQSRLYLYLVIDFAQGGDLYYFTEKKLWVKEMKRTLRKFKYPFYTNGGSQHHHRHLQSLSTQALPSMDNSLILASDPSARRARHRRHSSRAVDDLDVDTHGSLLTSAVDADAPLTSPSLRRHRHGMRQCKSTNDLASAVESSHSRRGHREHTHSLKRGASLAGDDVHGPQLITPPSQVLKPEPRLSTSESAVAATGETVSQQQPAAEDHGDHTSHEGKHRSVDLFSAEAVESLRRQREVQQQLLRLRQLDTDGENGTDTDINHVDTALAGAGASASTLNAVRAGGYCTTDAVDEFVDSKEVFSDAGGPQRTRHTPASLLTRQASASAGGEVANRAEDTHQHHMDDSIITTSSHHSEEQRRRRHVERSRAEAHPHTDDDDDDEDEDGSRVGRDGQRMGRTQRSGSQPVDMYAGASRLPPSLRRSTSRRDSAAVSIDDIVGHSATSPLASVSPHHSTSSPRPSSSTAVAAPVPARKTKRGADNRAEAKPRQKNAAAPAGQPRRRGARTHGGSIVTVHEPTATITSELTLEKTTRSEHDSPPPQASGKSAAVPSNSTRRSHHSQQPSVSHRAARRSRSQSGNVSPTSTTGSRHRRRAHSTHTSTVHSVAATPHRSTMTPMTPQRVDINASFHEVRTAASHVVTPPCRPDDSRLPLRLIAFYAIEVGLVLQYLHNSGFIYRDLKPENILMRRDGHIMLTDFGVAKYRKGAAIGATHNDKDGAASSGAAAGTGSAATTTTASAAGGDTNGGRATSFTGTAPYMSPEMVQGLPHDTRTDWWSFGCLLFEWCNGRKAFDEANQFSLFRSIVEEDVKVKEGDFQLTALELHSRVAQLHYRHQEFILSCLRARFISLPHESQSNVVAALTDASFSHATHTRLGDEPDAPPELSAKTAELEVDGAAAEGAATPANATHHDNNRFDNAPLGVAFGENVHTQRPLSADGPGAASPSMTSVNASMSRLPRELLNSLTGTPANLSFQFAPDGSISATVGATNPFAGISGEHMDLPTYETFMAHTVEQEEEALRLIEDLIRRLLNRNVQERLSGVDVLEHPFFTCAYITSQLYYQHYVKENNLDEWLQRCNEETTAEDTDGAPPSPPPAPHLMPLNDTGEPDLSPQSFLDIQPPVRRPDAWVDLFEERRVPPVYMPRLRTQDDLRYFPAAVTAMGLSAAAEQQKRIKEAKERKRVLLRHAVEQAAQQSGAVVTEDENGVYLSLPSPDNGGRTPQLRRGRSSADLSHAEDPPPGSPADLLRRVSSSLTSGTVRQPRLDPAPTAESEGKTRSSVSHVGDFVTATETPAVEEPEAKVAADVIPTMAAATTTTTTQAVSLTDRLSSLIAGIPTAEESDDGIDRLAASGFRDHGNSDSPELAAHPTLVTDTDSLCFSGGMRTNSSPLVLRGASTAVFSGARTSTSHGEEPLALDHTQTLMAEHGSQPLALPLPDGRLSSTSTPTTAAAMTHAPVEVPALVVRPKATTPLSPSALPGAVAFSSAGGSASSSSVAAALAPPVEDWASHTTSSSATTTSTPGLRSSDEVGSAATTATLSRTAPRAPKEDDNDDSNDDIMARTAVLPPDFVKAALAVAAAQQRRASVLPPSSGDPAPPTAAVGGLRVATPPPELGATAPVAAPMMAPSAVSVADPRVIPDLIHATAASTEGGVSGGGGAAMTGNGSVLSADQVVAPSTRPSGTVPTSPVMSDTAPLPLVAAPAEDLELDLGVDATGGYYETDALEEGDDEGGALSSDVGRDEAASPLHSPRQTESALADVHHVASIVQVGQLTETDAGKGPLAVAAEAGAATNSRFSSVVSSGTHSSVALNDTHPSSPVSGSHTFAALRGDGPLFDSNECSTSSARLVGAAGDPHNSEGDFVSAVVTSTSENDELRMRSHTAVLSYATEAPSCASSSGVCGDSRNDGVCTLRDGGDDGVVGTAPVEEAPDVDRHPHHGEGPAVDLEDELSGSVDPTGYEEDQESGNASDDDDDTHTATLSEEGDDEEASMYSDEEDSGTESYSCSGSSYSSSQATEQDANGSAKSGHGSHDDSTSTSTSSSSDDGAGFGTDQNLSFSLGRSGAMSSVTSPSGRPGGGMASVTEHPGAGIGRLSTGSLRYPSMLSFSTSYHPWSSQHNASGMGYAAGGGGSMSARAGEDEFASAIAAHGGPSAFSGSMGAGGDAYQGRLRMASRAMGPDDSVESGFRNASIGAARGRSLSGPADQVGGCAPDAYLTRSGTQSGTQSWWNHTQHPASSPRHANNSFGAAASLHSPSTAGTRGFPGLALSALYAPVNTLAGVSYDVEDDVHSPHHASRGTRQAVSSGRVGGGGGAANAVNSSFPGWRAGEPAPRRFTQSFGAASSFMPPSAANHNGVDDRHLRTPQSNGAGLSASGHAGGRPSAFSTTDTRMPPGMSPPPSLADGPAGSPDAAALSSHDAHSGAEMSYSNPSRRPVTSSSVPPSAFTVTNASRTSPTSGNASDDAEAPANLDHFANFSFFSAPSGVLPRGYPGGGGGGY